jgi:hypothetical protein
VRVPCVELSFFNDGKQVGNSRLAAASSPTSVAVGARHIDDHPSKWSLSGVCVRRITASTRKLGFE